MKVQIEENLYIESDTSGYQVTKYSTSTDKEGNMGEVKNALGYFSTVQGCAGFLLKLKIKETTATTLHELIKDVARIEQYIHDRINF